MPATAGDNLAFCLARELTRVGADLDNEAACTAALARGSEFLLREIDAYLGAAIDLAAAHCDRELARLRADITAEMAR